MTSYLTSIDTFSLSRTVFEIFDFKVFRGWPWPLEVTWGQKYFHNSKAHTWLPISNFYWHFLSISYRFWDIWLQSFQGLTLTFRGHLRSKIFSPFESSYRTSYLTAMDTFSYRFWDIWLQSFRNHLGSKIFSPFKSPYMTSYLTAMDTFSLSPTVFDIFDFKIWFWICMPTVDWLAGKSVPGIIFLS